MDEVNVVNNGVAAHERAQLLLDATPLACRLMKRIGDGKYELFECNEESIKLFKFKDKKEFIERYFDIFPEFQPDGSVSITKGQKLFEEAFKTGRNVTEFLFQTSDGEPIPTEVTLVRLEYGDDYIVAGYTRDLREHNLMMKAIETRNKLLNTGGLAVQALLATQDDTDIEKVLLESLEIVGSAVDADRVHIWRNEVIDGVFQLVHKYGWLSEKGRQRRIIPTEFKIPYASMPNWRETFSSGNHLTGILKDLSVEEQQLFNEYEIKTIMIIPLFIKNVFWGLFSIDDCENERIFTADEFIVLEAVSRMVVSAINRSLQATQIREAHDRTRLLLDTTPLAVHLWDKDLNLFECNEESIRLFKCESKQEYSKKFRSLSPEFQPDGLRSDEAAAYNIKRAFDEGKVVFEWVHRSTDGVLIPSEITLVRVAYGDDYAVAGYVRDLREQKEMLNEIQLKSTLLDSINQAANILLQSDIDEFEFNLQLCMGMIGKAVNADRVCIWKNSTIDGKLYCSLIDEWIINERLRTASEISNNISYEQNIPTFERILTKGECINSLVRDMEPLEQKRMEMHGIKSLFVAPVFVHDEFWGFVGCDNCTEESIFSDEVVTTLFSGSLLIANALLRNEMTLNLRMAAVELEAALMDTQKANNAKSDFLANMSHEMRTPLNAIIGLTLLNLENELLDEETRSNLEKTHNAGTSLLGIVNDILDISKIESGKLELVPIEYNPASLINDAITQNLLRMGDKPIKLTLDIDKNIFSHLIGDELRLKQIMNNLLSNAIKYTEEGEVILSVHNVREDNDVWLTIKVSDSGQGIKSEDIGKLFDDYSQLDTKANRKIEGTGLGLPITKRLCQLMGGFIKVESKYGKGSIFTVKLKQEYVTDEVIGPEVVASLNNFRYSDGRRDQEIKLKRISLPYARVLVVDDNPTNLDVARGLMKPYGMTIDCVDSGQKAIDAMSDKEPVYDAVFMDQMMPGMDGIEAARRIRGLDTEYAQKIPIIALTANAIVGNEEMFLSKGFQAFLSKPIDLARLDAVIRQWIRNREKEKQYINEGVQHGISYKNEVSQLKDKKVAGLDIEAGVKRFNDDEDVYINILQSYAVNTRKLLETIKDKPGEKLNNYEVTVHSIKGSSYGICADVAGRLAADLEKAAKAIEPEYIRKHHQQFMDVTWKLIGNIEDLLASLERGGPKPKMDKPDEEVISRLADACDAYDMDGVDAAMEEIAFYQYENDNNLVNWLKENVDLMNFEEIVERLRGEI